MRVPLLLATMLFLSPIATLAQEAGTDGPPSSGEESTGAPPHPSDVENRDEGTGRVLALYEWADDETLEAESARLKEERKTLKAEKKTLRKSKSPEDKARRKEIKSELKRNRTQRKHTRNLLVTPFAAPSYTPEMGGLFAGGALISFKTNRLDPLLQRSSLTALGGYSTTGAGMAFIKFTSFWLGDRLRITNENWFKLMPDNYWGVGYDAGRQWSEPNAETEFDRTWWSVDLQVLTKLKVDNLYGGLSILFNHTMADNVSDTMAQDPAYQEFGPNNFNGGLGVLVYYDSRDVAVTAWDGVYAKAQANFFGNYMGGDNTYQVYHVDYRQYVSLGKIKGNTLAWQIQSRIAVGDVPYGELSMVGNPFDLRAYQWGRYRDKTSLIGLLEYRLQFKRVIKTPGRSELGPHGLVTWVGIGGMGETYADMTGWLPNVGVGYRLELQPRMNLRVDFGVGNDSQGLYVNFMESF